MGFLTDRTLATGVTLQDLIHIVITGDTSQNPAGSSYKATIQQVSDTVLAGFTGNTQLYEVGTGTDSTQRVGLNNDASGDYSLVGGGLGNTASGDCSTVGGGAGNRAFGLRSTVSGGIGNTSSGYSPTVGGGLGNTASGDYSTVSGGIGNTSSGCNSTISGGVGNGATIGSTIAGGAFNTASCYSTVGGGNYNIAFGLFSTIGGGYWNTTSGCYSTISGGLGNTASGTYSFVGSGRLNKSLCFASTLSGGLCNTASGIYSTVGGGVGNRAFGLSSTVSGGDTNRSSGLRSFIGGGHRNTVIGCYSTISGGYINTGSGDYSSILGGSGNTVTHQHSSATGFGIKSVSACTFHTNYLALQNTPVTDSTNNNVLVRDTSTGVINQKDFTHYNFGLFVQTGDSVTVVNTITETTILDGGIGSLSVPANYFSPGDSFHVKIGGIVSANNGNTIVIKIKSGSVILGTDTITFTNGVTNRSWEFNADFTIRTIGGPTIASIMTNGTFMYHVNSDVYGGGFSTLNNTTFDTTNPNTLDFTVTWGSASAGNSIYSSMTILKKTF